MLPGHDKSKSRTKPQVLYFQQVDKLKFLFVTTTCPTERTTCLGRIAPEVYFKATCGQSTINGPGDRERSSGTVPDDHGGATVHAQKKSDGASSFKPTAPSLFIVARTNANSPYRMITPCRGISQLA